MWAASQPGGWPAVAPRVAWIAPPRLHGQGVGPGAPSSLAALGVLMGHCSRRRLAEAGGCGAPPLICGASGCHCWVPSPGNGGSRCSATSPTRWSGSGRWCATVKGRAALWPGAPGTTCSIPGPPWRPPICRVASGRPRTDSWIPPRCWRLWPGPPSAWGSSAGPPQVTGLKPDGGNWRLQLQAADPAVPTPPGLGRGALHRVGCWPVVGDPGSGRPVGLAHGARAGPGG